MTHPILKILSIYLACSALPCYSQGKINPPEMTFSSILVENIENSIDWYTNVFGCEKTQDPTITESFSQANLDCNSFRLELIQVQNALTKDSLKVSFPNNNFMNGFFKIGFVTERFDDWLEKMKAQDVAFHGRVVNDPISGRRMFVILDPDGNRIQFFE